MWRCVVVVVCTYTVEGNHGAPAKPALAQVEAGEGSGVEEADEGSHAGLRLPTALDDSLHSRVIEHHPLRRRGQRKADGLGS